MIVVDASAVFAALFDDGPTGTSAVEALRREPAHAPELLAIELLHAARRHVSTGALTLARAEAGLAALDRLAMGVHRHESLLPRVWDLRGNLSAYDATYVALAEALDAPLLTADRRLAAAPGLRVELRLVG